MDERDAISRRQVHDALTQRCFTRDWSVERVVYLGTLDPTALAVPVRIDVTDLDFVSAPPIYLGEEYRVTGRRLPHLLGETRSLCYYAKGSVILDRYDPSGTVLQCLEQADIVIRKAVRGSSDIDFANEFQAYWSSSFLLVDLPANFAGRIKARFLNLRAGLEPTGVICAGESWLIEAHLANRASLPPGEDCVVISTDAALSVNPNADWPPENLRDLNAWLGWIDPGLVGILEKSFATGEHPTRWIAIRAANGTFILSATLPPMLRTDEFQKSRRTKLPSIIARMPEKIPIQPTLGLPADVDYIFSRNMGNMANLNGKRILLIGAGTIGGFLSHQLAQSGAGAMDGRLTIVDKDELRTANLGRHLLGIPYIHRNKAEGCCEFIKQQLPMLTVDFHSGDALDILDASNLPYDLIIDATGEEAFSLAVNDRSVRHRETWPPVLFGYLVGNGAMAQSLFTGESGRACLKCLKPRLSGPSRFPTMRAGIEVTTAENMECADPRYIPYPVTRSVVAASLICETALAWARGSIGHRFRSHLFDPSQALSVKDGNPAVSRDCPACSPT